MEKDLKMKGLVMCLCAFAVFANAQNITFEDSNFKAALLSHSPAIDTNSDGEISQTEAAAVTNSLNVENKNISSMQGIEYFTNVKYLQCGYNQITALDVSNNDALIWLICRNNMISTLDVSDKTTLTYINCGFNQLSALDVSNNINLTMLYCGSNHIETLSVSNNAALTQLYCDNNQLTALDVSNNPALTTLSCGMNQFTTLDVTNNIALKDLDTRYSYITTVDLSNNVALEHLYSVGGQLQTLDLSNNPNLIYIYCEQNQISELNVSNCTSLKEFSCSGNQLTTLDVSNNTQLTHLYCFSNQLTSLYIKNGVTKTFNTNTNPFGAGYNFSNNPDLAYICVDEDFVQAAQNYVDTYSIGNNPEITSNCLMATQEVSKNKIYIYPNPVKDVLIIQGSTLRQAQSDNARIYDISGKLVKTFDGNSVNVSALQKGIYILNIDNQSIKFIKE
ncbi:MAG: leucine-rich repeat domain-containing protein [Flavobacteriaceae bacterium]|jgi:Leucine-rich repeat (LRR) protein|nr:leucine-rich repeat domain-containing protein [Flavobacteriaceae bacterium]